MKKIKIAISLDHSLLDIVDTKIDGSVIRSRSQAIEHFLTQGLKEEIINYGVIFLKGEHQNYAVTEIKGKPLIQHHFDLLESVGITNVFIVTQHSKYSNELQKEVNKSKLNVKIMEKDARGTGEALYLIRALLGNNDFVAMSGDIYDKFNLRNMIDKHIEYGKIATMGLVSRQDTELRGTAVLDGDLIVDFKEKVKDTESNIVNAGIYVFSHQVFTYMDKDTIVIESDLFPNLAVIKQLVGFFIHGEYQHMEEVE